MWNRLGIVAYDKAFDLTIINNTLVEDCILVGNYVYPDSNHIEKSYIHTIENNTINNKPIYYYKNIDSFTIPNDAGQVLLANCSNVTIKDTFFNKCDFPIILGFCSYCVIEHNTVDDAWGEIILLESDNCTIQNNSASNLIYGICLDYKSENNIVRYNVVKNNMAGITVMTHSKNNLVYENNIHDNDVGILLLDGAHHNNISDNKISENTIGFKLVLAPYENKIYDNELRKCKRLAVSLGRSKNDWNHNYWNRPRILPKIIFSYLSVGKINIPYFITGVDLHPAFKL
jgi:parallel beta-helix repeat protein